MKILFVYSFFLSLAMLACKPAQNNTSDTKTPVVVENSSPNQTEGMWLFEGKDSYSRAETVEIQIYHKQQAPLTMQRPMELELEVEENGQWREVRKLYCPCLQRCPPPPFQQEVMADEKITFRWQPEEKWCEAEPKSSPAPVGKYHLIVTHRVAGEKKLYFQHYVFNLKK